LNESRSNSVTKILGSLVFQQLLKYGTFLLLSNVRGFADRHLSEVDLTIDFFDYACFAEPMM
jgi:hypothetical protein